MANEQLGDLEKREIDITGEIEMPLINFRQGIENLLSGSAKDAKLAVELLNKISGNYLDNGFDDKLREVLV